MQAIGFHRFGGPEVLEIVDVPEPHANQGEVRIRVVAAAVSPADLLFRSGLQAPALSHRPTPHVPGMDIAGVVDEVGPGTTTGLNIGDAAIAVLNPFERPVGGYAAHVVVPAVCAVPAPRGWALTDAATLPMNGLTALLAMDMLQLEAGSTLAVIGAAGVLGGNIIQLAAGAGVTVIADAAPRDADLVRRLGATHVVSRGAGVEERIRELYPLGVDAVADAATYGPQSIDAVRDGGLFARFRGEHEPNGYAPEPARDITVISPYVPDYIARTDKLDEVRRLAQDGVLSPRTAGVHQAREAAAVHARLEAGGTRGRFVLSF